jgi:hypothetical protein
MCNKEKKRRSYKAFLSFATHYILLLSKRIGPLKA